MNRIAKHPHGDWYEHFLFSCKNKKNRMAHGAFLAKVLGYYGHPVVAAAGMICVELPKNRNEMTMDEFTNWKNFIARLIARLADR